MILKYHLCDIKGLSFIWNRLIFITLHQVKYLPHKHFRAMK